MCKKITAVCILAAALTLQAPSALATVTTEYLGSFVVPDNAGTGMESLTFLPGGVARETGDAVSGLTVITAGTDDGSATGDGAVEWSIPALSTTSGGLQTAAAVSAASNGTSILNTLDGGGISSNGFKATTSFANRVWALNGYNTSGWPTTQLVSFQAGISEDWDAGPGAPSYTTFATTTILPTTAVNGNRTGAGIAPKRDETNVLLTLRRDSSATNVYVFRGTYDSNTNSFSNQSQVFNFDGVSDTQSYNLEYIDIGGVWYYALTKEVKNEFALLLFNASTAAGSGVTPDYTFILTDAITNGAGWRVAGSGAAGSMVRDMAWNDVNNVLYVIDASNTNSNEGAYVHAFSIVPEPATMSILGLGGLTVIGGAIRRRRR